MIEEQPLPTVTPFPGAVPGQPQQPRLLDRVRIAIRTRHYSLRTEEAYVGWIKRYIFFHKKRHPLEMGEPEINAFLSSLAVRSRVAASTQNQALSALLFLYRNVLEKPFPMLDNLVRAKRPDRLPTVLTRDEVRRILGKMSGTNRIIATLLYGSGMRLLECLRLRVKDVEFGLNRILVRDAKGHKDRLVPLPVSLRPVLASWLARVEAIPREGSFRGIWRRLPAECPREKVSVSGTGMGLAVGLSSRRPKSRPALASRAPASFTRDNRPARSEAGRSRLRVAPARDVPHLSPLLRDSPD